MANPFLMTADEIATDSARSSRYQRIADRVIAGATHGEAELVEQRRERLEREGRWPQDRVIAQLFPLQLRFARLHGEPLLSDERLYPELREPPAEWSVSTVKVQTVGIEQ